MWLTVGLILGVFWLVHQYLSNVYSYWKNKGIPYLNGSFPFGSLADLILFRKYSGYIYDDVYKMLEPHPYGGIYEGREPVLLIRDPGLIGQILVKDFSHFRDRNRIFGLFKESINQNIIFVSGDHWRQLRLKLTPTFTSGKLKNMYCHFQKCSHELIDSLDTLSYDSAEIDIKDVMSRFTMDIICSCAFGLEMNSIGDPNNEVRKLVKSSIFRSFIPLKNKVGTACWKIFPFTRTFIRISLQGPKFTEFITNLISETVEHREKNKVTRNDFLDLLIDIKNNVKEGLTMDSLVAQCTIFFSAGFETSSSVMSFCFYELALNPGIQSRLRSEIDEVTVKHGGLTYDAIKEMSYLDQVISETIRKYPTVQTLHRTCTKQYRMPDSGWTIQEGTLLVIPTYSLHHDPKYFPDPEIFDPERFSPERKPFITPFTYLPFGEGPRNCIGMRFGLLQTKMGICTVLSKFELLKCEKTQVPIEFAPSITVTAIKGPIYLKIQRRS